MSMGIATDFQPEGGSLHSSIIPTKKRVYIKISLILILTLLLSSCSNHKSTVLSEHYKYDNKGRLIEKVTPNGSKITYRYNDRGLPVEINYSGGFVRYGYDANGNRIWMEDKTGKIEYRYDAFNRLIEVVFYYGPERRIRYEYDPWNRVSGIKILQNGRAIYQVKYEYDILGNPVSVDDGNGRIRYDYYPEKGEVIRYLPNGIKTVFSYSPLGELTSLKHLDRQNRLIASYRYEYDPPGKVSKVFEETSEGIKITKYDWDSRGYLKALRLSNGQTIRYEYDSMGNRILQEGPTGSIQYKYDSFARLIEAGHLKYKWDKNGNLFSFVQDGQKTRFIYDGRGLLSLVRLPRGTVRYGWDGDRNMIFRQVGKEMNYYLQNPLAPPGFTLAEYDKMGKIQSTYLYGDTLLAQRRRNGQMRYFLEDGFNSIRHITDVKGNIVGQRDYSPFGKPTLIKGDTSLNFRMAGERLLPEIKSYFIGGRLYEPKIGRYLTPDVSSNSLLRFDSFNQYAHSSIGTLGTFMEPRCNQTIKGPSIFPKFELIYTPIGYRPQDYHTPVFRQARKLIELGQRVPLPSRHTIREHDRYWGEGKYWDADPYYKGLKNLDQVAPLTPQNYLKAFGLALGNVGSSLAKGLLGGWGGAVKEGGDLFVPFTPQGKKTWNIGWTIKGLLNPLKFLGGELLEGAEHHFGKKYEEFTGCPIGEGDFKYLKNDPFKSAENKLGGIKLSSSAEFIGNLRNIAGAVYDREKQYLVLVGEEEDVSMPFIKAEDLAVALACTFDPRYGDPQFSLDPADPRNPRGKWLKAVYMPKEIISGTPFGKALFEADWLLKQYAFGVSIDEEGRKKERKSSVPGFKSTVDLTFERPDNKQGQEKWARFWIVSDEMKLREHGNSIYFDVARMRVKAKKQEPDPSSPTGLRDVETNDPIASAFADQFSKLYDEISKESPEFARVKELAKAVALAKWIKKEGIPIDMGWVTEYVNKRIQTVERITALSEQRERRTEIPFTQGNRSGIRIIIRQLHLFGGVDLTVNPKFKPDNGQAQSLQREVVAALRKKETGPVFKVTHEGKSLRAVVLPITQSGQEMWRNSPTIDKDGTTYQFNDEGIITKSTDKFGNITEYGYDLNKRLKTVKIFGRNGWTAFGERNELGSDWTVTDPRGNTVRYRYGTSGHLQEMEVDGKSITWDYYQRQRAAAIQHEGYVERLVFDADGYMQEYEVRRTARGTIALPEIEKLFFSYDGKGNITKIAGPGLGHMDISYSEDGLPIGIRTPWGGMYFSYDSESRMENISVSNGPSISYFYDGENLEKMEIKSGDKCAEYVFSKEGIVQGKDLLGGQAEYGYTSGKLSSVRLDQYGEARYVYDDLNRLREIHLPNGNWIEYCYQERRGKREGSPQGQVVTIVTHSSSPLVRKTSKEAKEAYHTELTFLDRRLQDIREASRMLNNGVIMDVFGRGGGIHACVADSRGDMREMNPKASRELRKLLNITAKTRGKLGKTILDRWGKFYNANLARLAVPVHWRCPDGREIKLKPILIIKSNEVTYKYANLEKVPVLAKNFVIFIASKTKESKDIPETSAKDLVTKINGVPTLSRENVVFAIRLPEMRKEEQAQWESEIAELERVVGKENVLFNPSKDDFNRMLQNRGKEIIVIELTHTDRGITLRENERYTSKDLLECGDLSHIKYLIAGPGTCSLPRLEKGNFAATLREKGVGIMNTSYREVSTEIALKRLRELIRILKDVEEYNLPAYYLPDMIDQLIGIPEEGTTNLGRLYYHKDRLFG